MGGAVAQEPAPVERMRLHITPFNHELLDKLLPASLQSQTRNISFHALQTHPDRGFGFLELPTMEAQKLKKKFNGMTLRGAKVRIEEAKPEKKRKSVQTDLIDEEKARKKTKREKTKREHEVLLGHELENGRVVKRGWTEKTSAKGSKREIKEEGDQPLKNRKMRFRTSVPAAAITEAGIKKKSKKSKEGASKTSKSSVVVSEFTKTSKLRASTVGARANIVTLYEDGKGWLDEDGNVVEAEPASLKRQSKRGSPIAIPVADDQNEIETEEQTNSSTNPSLDLPESNSMRGTALSSSTNSVESTPLPDNTSDHSSSLVSSDASSPISTDSSDEEPLSTPKAESLATVKEIHPLEALYKRPKPSISDGAILSKTLTPINTSFNFFGSEDANDMDTDDIDQKLPQTPHTKKDLEWRSIRSAAPTPDTAAIGKRFSFALADEDEEGEKDEDENEDNVYQEEYLPKPSSASQQPDDQREESDFRRWFYDNRGDLNRGWKKRRREERKLQRQRENRRLGRRVA